MTKVISVASGKGGAGKTIVTLALARLIGSSSPKPVFVVDLDFHVKGLTFSWFRNLSDLENETFSLYEYLLEVDKPEHASDIMSWLETATDKSRVNAILIPSYRWSRQMPDYEALGALRLEQVLRRLSHLITAIGDRASYIIIDTRAGVDNFCFASSLLSDLTIILTEQDRISFRASYDLQMQIMKSSEKLDISGMEGRIKGKLPFFVFNKVTSPSYLSSTEVSNLPPLPFDSRLFAEYGKDAHRLISKGLERTSFYFYLRRMWTKACEELGIAERPKGLAILTTAWIQFKRGLSVTSERAGKVFVLMTVFLAVSLPFFFLQNQQLLYELDEVRAIQLQGLQDPAIQTVLAGLRSAERYARDAALAEGAESFEVSMRLLQEEVANLDATTNLYSEQFIPETLDQLLSVIPTLQSDIQEILDRVVARRTSGGSWPRCKTLKSFSKTLLISLLSIAPLLII